MANPSSFEPNWFSPPGETLSRHLKRSEMTVEELSSLTEINTAHIDDLIVGSLKLTPQIAEALELVFGVPAGFWLARERQYREQIELCASRSERNIYVGWLERLPIADMQKFGWIDKKKDVLEECLRYFSVSGKEEWDKKYEGEISVAKFRLSFNHQQDFYSIMTWLRKGELESKKLPLRSWSAVDFRESISEIRKFVTNKNPKNFFPKLRKICADAGVAVVVAPTPRNCPISGATRFTGANEAMMLLSFRYRTDDQFWFTFFHEAGHLIRHSKKALFLEDGSDATEREEVEANRFSEDVLIPEKYKGLLDVAPKSHKEIIRLATKIGVSPGVLVGQLQHHGRIKYSHFNKLKRKFVWEELINY